MPTGKVKWYDEAKGFGFLADDEGGDVFLHANSLPEGVTTLKGGTRVEFSVAAGRRGAQAMQVTLLDPPPSVAAGKRAAARKPAEEMVVIVEDLINLLDTVGEGLRHGRHPDKEFAGKVAQVMRAVATEIEA